MRSFFLGRDRLTTFGFGGRLPLLAFLCALLALAPDAPGQAPRELLVGASLSASGKYAVEGRHVRRGYDLAAERLNKQRPITIDGQVYHLRILYYDDVSDPKTAAENAERLITEDEVRFLLGPYSSTLTHAVQKVAEKHAVPLIQANGASRALRSERYRYHFAVLASAEKDFAGVVDLFNERAIAGGALPGSLKAALIFEEDTYSQDVRLGAIDRLRHHGIYIVLDETFPETLDDISGALEKIKALEPHLLLISGHARGAATAAEQMAELGVDVPMVAMTQCDAAYLVRISPKGAEHVVCPLQWHVDLPFRDDDLLFGTGADFSRLFKERYRYLPPYQSAQSSAAVQVLADAVTRAGTLYSDAVREALLQTDFTSFYGKVNFNRVGSNIAKDSAITQVIDGEFVLIAPAKDTVDRLVYPRAGLSEQ